MGKIKIIILLLIMGISIILWSRFIGTKGLIIKEYAIYNSKIPNEYVGKKIVQFSDLHYASTIKEEELKAIIKNINSLKPDIIVFTGDFIEKKQIISEKEKEIIITELSKLECTIGKYAVKGNHDYEYDFFEEIMEKTNFTILKDKYEYIYYKSNTPIVISGVTSELKEKNDLDKTFKYQEEENNYFSIFLAHEPDTLLKARKYNIDLMLSGHSHGGQVRIPFVGALITPKGSKTYYEEHYKQDETDLYISSGIGTSLLKLRLFNKPSINLFRLYKK